MISRRKLLRSALLAALASVFPNRSHAWIHGSSGGGGAWLLATGIWNDSGIWDDAANWMDAA